MSSITTPERVDLADVPETMLWTLHNRAHESLREDSGYTDPEAVRIYQSIDYDFERSFGKAEPSHAVRSTMMDAVVRQFVTLHPGACVVNLGEGLETQRYRLAELDAHWFSVDLAEAMAVRERFIQPDQRHQHLVTSATDMSWCDAIPAHAPVVITAQGLLMYFPEEQVQALLQQLTLRFPGAWVVFDTIPEWLSRKTCSPEGCFKTPHYRTPPMPWGISPQHLEALLRRWLPTLERIQISPYKRFPRGPMRWLLPLMNAVPFLRHHTPVMVTLELAEVAP